MCAAVAVVLAAAVSCCNKAPKVTALVAGPEAEPVALVVDYGAPVSAESVSPDCFVVPGREIENVFVADCPEAASSVIILLKGNCPDKPCEAKPCDKPCDKPCCKEAKPCDKPCDKEAKPCDKPCDKEAKPCDKPCDKEAKPCDKPAEEQCDKCKAGEPCEAKPCDKPAEEQCDKCKAGEPCEAKPCDKEAKPCGKPDKKQCKKDGKCELPVPEIAVRQVAPVTGVDGKEIKPWKKDAKATAAAPAPCPHHHGKPCRK